MTYWWENLATFQKMLRLTKKKIEMINDIQTPARPASNSNVSYGVLWCRGKIIYYLGPRYIKQNLGWYLPPFKTPQPPSVLFYYVGTLFQQPAKVINHCHAARRRWRRLPRRQWSTFQFFWWIFLHKTDSLHQIMIICHRTS